MEGALIFIVLLILVVIAIALIAISILSHTGDRQQIFDRAILLITVPKEFGRKADETGQQPRDFKELIATADQFFSSLSSLCRHDFWSEMFGHQPTLSFEIVVENDRISFYLVCPKGLVSQIEKQLNSFYPHAQIERVNGHNIFSVEQGVVAAAVLVTSKRYIFPIRTYKQLDAEPLNSITNVLSKMGEGSNAAIQLVISPLSDRWRYPVNAAAKQVLEGKHHYIYSSKGLRFFHQFLDLFRGSIQKNAQTSIDQQKTTFRLTPAQEDLMKSFNEKGAKVGFKTTIRILTVAPNREAASVHLQNVISAFAQFAAPAWNSFRQLSKVNRNAEIVNFIFRRLGSTPKLILNTEELSSIFHLPNRWVETPNIQWLTSRSLPPPTNLPPDGVVIGESVFRGETKLIRMQDEDRLRHIFMIGKTGVGKTTLFENMIDQDIRAGKGVCFIDPLGDAIESILAKIPPQRAEDVVLFDPSDTDRPMGLNLLQWRRPEEKDFLIAEWIEIFYKLFDPNRTGIIGPQWEHWGRNAALTIMAQPEGGSLLEIPRLFVDDAFREQAISYVKDPVIQAFWQQQLAKTADFHKSEMYNYFISKFGRFMTNDLMRNIIGQSKSAFDLREIMDSGKILLINLAKGKIGEMNSNLLGLILVSKLQTAAFSRADTPEEQRRPFYLYVDEFQNFTTDSFATILSEARKYRLSLNITNQFIAQLTEKIRDAVIGNAGTMIVYRIGAADAEFMAKEFPGVTIDDMVNLDRFTTYVKLLIDLTPSKPFSMKGLKSPVTKNSQTAEAIRQISRLKYGQGKGVVERDIHERTRVLTAELAVATGGNEPLAKV